MGMPRPFLIVLALMGVTLVAAGCGGCVDSGTGTGGTGGTADVKKVKGYNPADDPLVNPDSLFEPIPEDKSRVDSNATLYRLLEGNPNSLLHVYQSSTYEYYLQGLMWDSMFTFDKNLQWKLDKNLIRRLDTSDDHMTWTVHMRDDTVWHDGTPVTAHDVEFSWKQILDERVPVVNRVNMQQLDLVKALDDHTVQIKFKEKQAINRWNAGVSILPKHLYSKDLANNPDMKSGPHYVHINGRGCIANGAYRLAEWIENDKIVLERFEDYAGEKPHFKRVVFRIIEDKNIGLLSFNNADVDEFRLSAKQFATQTAADSDFGSVGYKVWAPQWTYAYYGWNMDGSNPFFNDKRVRIAMTHACNIPRMLEEVTYNLYEQARGVMHSTSPYYNPDVKLYEYDLEKAAALLDEAGWKVDPTREGWRHKVIDGVPVKFEFTMQISVGSSTGVPMSAIFQEDLRSIGVDMKTTMIEWATFTEKQRKHEFQAFTAGWGVGVDPDYLWNIWHSESYIPDGTSGRNYGKYANDRVDELFRQGRVEMDQEKRKKIYAEIAKLIYEDQPYIFIYNRSVLWGVNKRIHGLQAGPRGIFNFDPADRGWWVEPSRDKG